MLSFNFCDSSSTFSAVIRSRTAFLYYFLISLMRKQVKYTIILAVSYDIYMIKL